MIKLEFLGCFIFLCIFFPCLHSQSGEILNYQPSVYACTYLSPSSTVAIDGEITESAWQNCAWTDLFMDIEGTKKQKPYLSTRAKMAWDDTYFYVAAELQETHIWATYENRDMILFHENNFEVFIDPDGDTHQYIELEINALSTIWDLLLVKPYHLGGTAINNYDIKGLKKAVKLFGTNNLASDKDDKWTVEIAIPWSAIAEINPQKVKPIEGDYWKLNFSRVQWDRDIKNGQYIKQKVATDQKTKPENNWVWSPQGFINMHRPELWGIVVFVKSPNDRLLKIAEETDKIKWQLRKIFLHQQSFFAKYNIYTTSLPADLRQSDYEVKVLGDTFVAKYCKNRVCYYIREDGRVWEKKP